MHNVIGETTRLERGIIIIIIIITTINIIIIRIIIVERCRSFAIGDLDVSVILRECPSVAWRSVCR